MKIEIDGDNSLSIEHKEEIAIFHKSMDLLVGSILINSHQGPDFDDMSSFFLCEIDDAIQYISLGYGAQTPKIVIL